MKRIVNPLALAIVLVWVLSPGPSYGYAGPDRSDDGQFKNRNQQQRKKPGRSGPAAKDQKRGSSKEDSRQLMRDVTKLHEAMKQRIKLSDKQVKTIDGLFEAHLQQLRTPTRGRKSGETEKATGETSRELREQLAAARKSGDAEAVKAIREQVRVLMGQREGDGAEERTARFLQKVADQLTQEQKQSFQRILKRLKLDRFGERRGMALRGLMRAIHNPQVKLSDEQKREIRKLTSDTYKSAGVEGRSGEMSDQVTEELQTKILAKLTDEQRATVEQLLKSEKPRADRAAGKSGDRGKGGNRAGKGGGQRRP